ncbi:MAG: hypothetical protein ACFFAY_06355 [Promethearchaeota archaeon]
MLLTIIGILREVSHMFTMIELTVMMSFATMILSLILATYLISLWKDQETRLYTDLPLMLGVIFVTAVMSQALQLLGYLEIVEMTVEVFRFRSLIVLGMALPMLGVMLHIWQPHRQKHHSKIVFALSAYWIVAEIISPTSDMIMTLTIPPLIFLMVGWLITFSITWKTGRLKEVRSDLMVLGTLITMFGQIGRIPFTNIGLAFLPDTLNALGMIFFTLALINPWYKREVAPLEKATIEQDLYA